MVYLEYYIKYKFIFQIISANVSEQRNKREELMFNSESTVFISALFGLKDVCVHIRQLHSVIEALPFIRKCNCVVKILTLIEDITQIMRVTV